MILNLFSNNFSDFNFDGLDRLKFSLKVKIYQIIHMFSLKIHTISAVCNYIVGSHFSLPKLISLKSA